MASERVLWSAIAVLLHTIRISIPYFCQISQEKEKKKKQDFSHLVDGCVEEKIGEGGDED